MFIYKKIIKYIFLLSRIRTNIKTKNRPAGRFQSIPRNCQLLIIFICKKKQAHYLVRSFSSVVKLTRKNLFKSCIPLNGISGYKYPLPTNVLLNKSENANTAVPPTTPHMPKKFVSIRSIILLNFSAYPSSILLWV